MKEFHFQPPYSNEKLFTATSEWKWNWKQSHCWGTFRMTPRVSFHGRGLWEQAMAEAAGTSGALGGTNSVCSFAAIVGDSRRSQLGPEGHLTHDGRPSFSPICFSRPCSPCTGNWLPCPTEVKHRSVGKKCHDICQENRKEASVILLSRRLPAPRQVWGTSLALKVTLRTRRRSAQSALGPNFKLLLSPCDNLDVI